MNNCRLSWALYALLFAFLAGCGGSTSGDDDDDEGSDGGPSINRAVGAVTVSAGGDSLAVGDQVSVRATVINDTAVPLDSIPVTFGTTAGQLSSETATTDADGVAEVTLTAPDTTGTAQISAPAEGVPGSVSLAFVAGPVGDIQLSATPTVIAFNRSTSLSLQLRDNGGNPVADQVVNLQTPTNESQGTFENLTVTTDINGRATGVYTAGNTAGSDMLQAQVSATKSNPVAITVDPDAARLDQLALRAGSDEIVANGSSNTFVRATVIDTDERSVEGVRVTFSANAGTLDTESALTDANGIASIDLTAGTRATTAQVLASVGGLNQTALVEFVPGPVSVANSSITVNPSSLPADGSSTTEVTVTLADANGNPVADDTRATLQAGAGQILSTNPMATMLGRATFTLQAPENPAEAQVSVLEQPELSSQVRFGAASSGTPASIQIDANPQSISVAGVGQDEQSNINLTILDDSGNTIKELQYNNAALDNVRITLITRPDGGEFLAGTSADGSSVDSLGNDFIDVRSTSGTVTLNLQSGTRPGIIEARVQVLGFNGTRFGNTADVPTTASLPQITIASGPPHTLVFTSPVSDSIIDEGGGVYSRRGTVIVTDRFGNSVPDGTAISLGLMDSVIAKGTGTIVGGSTTLSAQNFDFDTRCLTLSTCNTTGTFNFTSTINRNDVARGIQGGDRMIIRDAQAEDKGRFVDGSSIGSATTLGAQSAYDNDAQPIHFAVGASLLGAEVSGIDADDNLQTGTGTTMDGRVPFRVTYPANRASILVGCYGNDLDGLYTRDDKRFEVPQSAQVYVVASSSDDSATGVDRGQFCFSGIAGSTLQATPASASGDASIALELRDGGDGILLPFVPVSATWVIETRGDASSFDIVAVDILPNAENSKPQTGINGVANASIDINCDNGVPCESGDSATVTFRALDASVEVEVSIP